MLGVLPRALSRMGQWPEKSTQDESPACTNSDGKEWDGSVRLEMLGVLPRALSRMGQWPEKSTQDESPACSGRLRVRTPLGKGLPPGSPEGSG